MYYFAHFANINLQVYWCEPAIVMLLFGLHKKTAGMRSGNYGIMTRGWGWLVRIGTPWWRSKKPDLTIGKGNLALQRLVSWDRTLRSHYYNMVCHLSHVLLLHKKTNLSFHGLQTHTLNFTLEANICREEHWSNKWYIHISYQVCCWLVVFWLNFAVLILLIKWSPSLKI